MAFAGNVTVAGTINSTGTITGTLATAAQGSVTSLGTLTTLTVDNVIVNGTTIGHTSDTDLMTLASGVLTVAGEISVTTLDIGGTNVTSTAAELNLVDGSSANSVVNSKAVIYGSSGELAGTLSTAAQTNVTSLGTLTGLTTSGNLLVKPQAAGTAHTSGDTIVAEDGTAAAMGASIIGSDSYGQNLIFGSASRVRGCILSHFYNSGTNRLDIAMGPSFASALYILASSVCVNEGGADMDFRVESTDETHCLTVDAGLNNIAVCTSSPSYGGGDGIIMIGNVNSAPGSNPSGGGILYVDSGALKYRGSSGTVSTMAIA